MEGSGIEVEPGRWKSSVWPLQLRSAPLSKYSAKKAILSLHRYEM